MPAKAQPFRAYTHHKSTKHGPTKRRGPRGPATAVAPRDVTWPGAAKTIFRAKRTSRGKLRRLGKASVRSLVSTTVPSVYSLQGAAHYVGANYGKSYLCNIAQWNDAFDLTFVGLNIQQGQSGLNNKFMVKSFRGTYSIKSGENFDQILDLYYYTARRDLTKIQCPLVPNTEPPQTTLVSTYDPTNVLLDGFGEQTGSTITRYNWPNQVTPFQVRKFTDLFKITRVKRVMLAGGRDHIITIVDNKPKFYDLSLLVNDTGNGNSPRDASIALPGKRACGIFAIARGTPVNDAVTKGNTSTSLPNFLLTVEEAYIAYSIKAQTTNQSFQGSYGTIGGTSPIQILADAAIAGTLSIT